MIAGEGLAGVAIAFLVAARTRWPESGWSRWLDSVHFAGKEFELLSALADEPTRVFTKDELLRNVWGYRSFTRTRTLDWHVSRLRQKLERAPDDRFVVNVWGVGYKLTD